MIDPKTVCLFQPSELKKFKADLFQRIGVKIRAKGGRVILGNVSQLKALPKDVIPIVGCSTYLKGTIDEWREKRRPFIYWDRGYYFRVFATWLPKGENGGMYRWDARIAVTVHQTIVVTARRRAATHLRSPGGCHSAASDHR